MSTQLFNEQQKEFVNRKGVKDMNKWNEGCVCGKRRSETIIPGGMSTRIYEYKNHLDT